MNTIKVLVTVGCLTVVSSALSAEVWCSTNSEVKVKFSATRISLTKSTYFDYLQGKVSLSARSSKKYFKRPILRVVVLTDENGARAVRDTIIDEPNLKIVDDMESSGRFWCRSWWSDNWVTKTTTMPDHGYTGSEAIGKNEMDPRCRTVSQLSSNQVEVAKAKYSNVTYIGLPLDVQTRKGLKGLKQQTMFGYCRFDEDEKATMLGYRLEVWQNGECIAYWDSIRASDIKRLELPEDWHVSFAHPEKFKYRSPWATKEVVRQ